MKHSSLLGYIHTVLLYLKDIETGIANAKFLRAIYEWENGPDSNIAKLQVMYERTGIFGRIF